MAERTCSGCGVGITPGRRERNKRKWCSEACRQLAARIKRPEKYQERLERSRDSNREKWASLDRRCVLCNEPLTMGRKKYCEATECQRQAHAARARAQYSADPAAGSERVQRQRAKRTPEQIERDRAYQKARRAAVGYTDSNRAADARRRARKAEARIESFTHIEIFDRDGWRCEICKRRIDKTLTYPHPKSVSLDHIVPLALGGSHSRANVRAAHLGCNVERGAARGETLQLALI